MKKSILLFALSGTLVSGLATAQCNKGQPPTQSEDCLVHVWNNPKSYPNFTIVNAHRGYWKDVPENSIPAIRAAKDLGVEAVELDVMKSKKDSRGLSQIFLMHDWKLDRLTDSKGTLRDKNWNFLMPWSQISQAKLLDPIDRSKVTKYRIPLLENALKACRDYKPGQPILISIDKADTFMDEVYLIVKKLNMTDVVTWKTKIQIREYGGTPEGLKKYYRERGKVTSDADLNKMVEMYTPTIFGEYYAKNKSAVLEQMDKFMEAGVTGFEMVYFDNNEAMLKDRLTRRGKNYNNVLDYLRDRNTRVIQFPEWPETCQGNWSPARNQWRDINVTTDRRGDWWWLMSSGEPDVVITDRLEVFVTFLKQTNRRRVP
ncbi:MAG: glycerophosphodiester phosphodiesterase family protein [Reichenbachiella sp.]|uniref:glycerophosphodiester phosphodiesterase family protein n=1 Tax=Reichenbachiella sp. TaxID=2184521 RepID=UPI003264036A